MPSPISHPIFCLVPGLLTIILTANHVLIAQEANHLVIAQDTVQPISDDPTKTHFAEHVAPFLETHCIDCHSGDFAEAGIQFEKFTDNARIQTEIEFWEKVSRLVKEGQMPPEDIEPPPSDEVTAVLGALKREIDSFDCTSQVDPGRVTIRRLNRAEYNNTVRDLTGLQLELASDFPADDVGEGFDNIGDVLAIPPVLMEKYLSAAEEIAKEVVEDQKALERIFPDPEPGEDHREAAMENLRQFISKAYRRPATNREMDRFETFIRQSHENGMATPEIQELVLTAIFANPNFLFRVEQDPSADDEDGIRNLNDFELATRLSYFLWSTMPDDELFRLAHEGKLTDPEVVKDQVERMLADPKSVAIVENFAGQWLQLRDVSRLTPDPETFPGFDEKLQAAIRRETEVFFENIIAEDRSVLEFLNADYTFVNDRLAEHYGMEDVQGDQFRRVSLDGGRRGVLTHASILLLTSNPNRTSPVKRGKWILDNILAEPPPPPPPDVPELEESGETLGTLREQMEQHRSNPSCAACHTKMDALGFGLENFDAIGGWRDRDGRFEIDASGELPGGRKFDGAGELMTILVEEKKIEFCRCLARKMLTYALGRGVGTSDRCAVNEIVSSLENNDYRFSALVNAIVTSDPFTQRAGRKE